MSDQLQQLQTEDWVLFLSTVLGSAGMVATNNPSYMLYGLTVGASSKALLSLGTNWKSAEDWLLFAGTFCGALGASLTGNMEYATYGLVLASVGKSLPSLANRHGSVEDWLLFVFPVVSTIISVIASSPGTANLGLFFGMIGKSLASTNPMQPGGSQSGGTQTGGTPSGLSGNRNYILWNQCNPLVNPSVIFTASSDIHANGNWDIQVNAYAPSGADAYMQFVLAVTAAGEVQWSIENWPISGNNLFNTCDQHLFQLPSGFLPNGYSISLRMNTDPVTKNVTSLDLGVSDANGASVAQKNVKLDASLPLCNGSWNDSYLSQVIGFEPNIVGYNGGVAVAFSAGCGGTLRCFAEVISATSSIPSCAETKAGTVEDSNMAYSVAVQSSQGLVSIGATAA
jgi:hypothetical protein